MQHDVFSTRGTQEAVFSRSCCSFSEEYKTIARRHTIHASTKYDAETNQDLAKMADAALLEALGSLKIERRDAGTQPNRAADHHVLSFNYPAFDIQHPYETVQLDPPSKLEHRQRPPQDSRELALYDTDFAMALPIHKVVPNGASYDTAHMRLFAAIEALKAGTGTTMVGVLKVYQEIWDEAIYRVRVQTEWIGPFPNHPPQDFELNVAEWAALVSFADQRPWIGLLKHLVERASAKAYYHVRQRIMNRYGPAGPVDEENSWPTTWGAKQPSNAAELFQERLTPIYGNIMEGIMPQMMLECGHSSRLTCSQAADVNSKDVLHAVCEICEDRILKPEDDEYLHDVADKKATQTYQKLQRVWANLVHSVEAPTRPRIFHSMTIFRILGAAFESLKSPEWVSPAATCPSRMEETKEVLEHLESMFWDQNQWYTKTAEELLIDLEQEAMGVRIDGVPLGEKINPPGWDDFIARWLRRSAFFLAYRQCMHYQRGKYGCRGLHWHSDGLWYSPDEWQQIEQERFEEEEPAPFSMVKIMDALEGIEV